MPKGNTTANKSASEGFRNWAGPVSQVLAVALVLAGGIVWGYRLEDRMQKQEALMQALLTSSPQSPASTANPSANSQPLKSTCDNLAERAASLIEKGGFMTADEIKKLMGQLNCIKN